MAYDAIIVGGGHNGLVSAAYLAKAGLRTHGLEIIEPEVVAFAPSADGPGLTLWRDAVRTANELRDGDAFVAFDRKIRSMAGFVARMQATEPPDLASPSLA